MENSIKYTQNYPTRGKKGTGYLHINCITLGSTIPFKLFPSNSFKTMNSTHEGKLSGGGVDTEGESALKNKEVFRSK